jgi:predicted alpha/beta superfamily hydrolase
MSRLFLFAVLLLALPGFAQRGKGFFPNHRNPIVLGYSEEFYSHELGENRVLNCWLPKGYVPGDTMSYPVIYLLDGGLEEDFIHTVGMVHYDNLPWIDYLPPSIIIGIANVDRMRDFTFPSTVKKEKKMYPAHGGSADFISFLTNEVRPYIEQNYRTNGHHMLIGQSLGGLLAAQVLLTRPSLFDQYVIISPSLWWDNGSLLKRDFALTDPGIAEPIRIFIATGKEGQAPAEGVHVMEEEARMFAEEISRSWGQKADVSLEYFPEEDHATIMHPALFRAFRWMGGRR